MKGVSRRKVATRTAYEVVLIVCEGLTEVTYFDNYKSKLKTFGIEVKAISDEHNDPIGIVKDAIKKLKEEKAEHTWCVFDRDHHTQHQLNQAKQLAEKNKIHIAFSNPCFEIWLLLHFKYSSAPYRNYDELEKALKQIPELSSYQKETCYFNKLLPLWQTAVKNSKKLILEHKTSGNSQYSVNSNPSTSIHEVVEFLHHKQSSST